MADVFPPELGSPVGRVRKYIPDLVQLEDPKNPTADPQYYFSDLEIEGFLYEYVLSVEDEPTRSQVKRAAADVIDSLANNEALILKKIKTEDLETDGPATANALRNGARALRVQADDEEEANNAFFEITPFRHNHPQTVLPWRFR